MHRCCIAWVAAAVSVTAMPAEAQQQQLGPNSDRLRMEAPIGHRQPRPSDLPAKVQKDEKNPPAEQNARALDSQMTICRGC
jgi:hypothetical protein